MWKHTIMEDLFLPHWCFESAVLLVCMTFLVVAVICTLIEVVRWIVAGVKRGMDAWKVAVFLVLLVASVFPGFVYHKMNVCWVATLLHLTDAPSWDMMSAGITVQKTIIAYTLRTLSVAIVYAISSCIIRRDREKNQ